MRVEELSVGDWVQDKKGTKAQILGIEKWSDGYELNVRLKGVDVGNAPATSAHPIPLTPEILEKNGFELLALSARRWENQALAIAAVRDNKMGCWIICEADHNRRVCFEMCVENVHELQHVFRLAGIEKEIELI